MISESNTTGGTIVKGVGGTYTVRTTSGSFILATPRGLFRKKRMTPTVGDRVSVISSGDPDIPYVITEIHPRKNLLVRPSIANVDVLILTFSTKQPSPYYELLDKLLILCIKNTIHPVIWITKMDLDPGLCSHFRDVYESAGFEVICSSNTEPIEERLVGRYFDGNTVGFAGQSGVGKSTLCNLLTGIPERRVGKISERLNLGKHTTRHVELFSIGEGFLIDSPGFTNLNILEMNVEIEDILAGYPEIERSGINCRFDDCLHIGEQGCAIEKVQMDDGRLSRYREFIRSANSQTFSKPADREKKHGK